MNDTRQTDTESPKTGSWWKRLSGGLGRTSSSLGSAITGLVSNRRLDEATLEELEAELIRADLGQDVAFTIADALGQGRYPQGITPDEVKAVLAGEIEKVLGSVAKPLEITARPFIVLVAGVNGSWPRASAARASR
jgi:fused signal recognition particle receptor